MRKQVTNSVLMFTIVAAAATAQVEDYRQIEFPPLAEFQIPQPEVFELDNGLKVFLMEDRELPLINVVARVRTGSLWEPAEKTGLARLTGVTQRTGGTARMNGDEIDDFLESRAASVETNIGGGVGFAAMNCLRDDFDEVLEVFVDVLRSPEFSADKLEIAKVQAKEGIARRNDNVLGITGREFSRLIYGYDSPLARLEEYATIAAIDRDGLKAWHARHYHPNNIYLGISGDFDSATMKTKIASAFGDWPRGPEFAPPPVPFREEQSAGVYFIEKKDVTQANVRMGHLGVRYDNPDYFALQVMNEILAGGGTGRLFKSIRTEKGLAYSVGGGVGTSFLYPGLTDFRLQTKSESVGEAVDALFAEVQRMAAEPPTEDELVRAKDAILNSFIFNYASKDRVLGQQMLYAYYGLPADFLESYRRKIEQVNAADVARVAATYLQPGNATLLLVGNAEEFDRPLEEFGEVQTVDISIPPPPATTPDVEATDEALARGREILDSVVATLGGDDPTAAEAVRTESLVEISIQGQTMSLAQKILLVFPDRVHLTIATPAGEQTVVLNEEEGFVMLGGNAQTLPAERVAQQRADLKRDLGMLVRLVAAGEVEAVYAGEEVVTDEDSQVVALRLGETATRLWVAGDGRILKQLYQGNHPFSGAPVEFEIYYTDYREIEGRHVPFMWRTLLDGTAFATATVEKMEFDPAYDETIFSRPAE